MNEVEQQIWSSHERRLNDNENRFNAATKDFTEIKDALKQLSERLNEGVSKTMGRILEKDSQIELQMRDLTHAVELQNLKLNDKVDTIHKSLIDRIDPLEDSNRNRDKVYVWGVLAGLILGIVGFATTKLMDKMWPKDAEVSAISNLKAAKVGAR